MDYTSITSNHAQIKANAMLQSRERARADKDDNGNTEAELTPFQNYSFKFEQPLTPQPETTQRTELQRDHITEKQDLAAAMIEHARQPERAEPATTLQQAQKTAREQTAPSHKSISTPSPGRK